MDSDVHTALSSREIILLMAEDNNDWDGDYAESYFSACLLGPSD